MIFQTVINNFALSALNNSLIGYFNDICEELENLKAFKMTDRKKLFSGDICNNLVPL